MAGVQGTSRSASGRPRGASWSRRGRPDGRIRGPGIARRWRSPGSSPGSPDGAGSPASLGDAIDPPRVLPEHLALDRGVDAAELLLDRLLREGPRTVAMRIVRAPHDVVRRDLGHRLHAV